MSRRITLIFLLAAAFLSGCAYQGVITEKRFRPLPFYESVGVDAIYNFQLRDSAGMTHSQMVTPEVFASYRVGDFFNDLQPPPVHPGKEMPNFRAAPPELNHLPYQPVRVMQLEPLPRNNVVATVASGRHQRPPVTAAATAKTPVATAKKAVHTLQTKPKMKVAAHVRKKSATTSKTAKVHRRTQHAAKIAASQQRRSKQATKVAKVRHRTKHTTKVAQSKNRHKKRVNISRTHRTRSHSKVGASSNA